MSLVRLFDIEGVPVLADDASPDNVGKVLMVAHVNSSGDVTEWVLNDLTAGSTSGGYGTGGYGI